MTPQLLGDEIRRWGASLMGFADIREFAPWPRAISIALALDPIILKGVTNGPTAEYYKDYLRANTTLNEIAQRTARLLLEASHRAEAFPCPSHPSSKPASRLSPRLGLPNFGNAIRARDLQGLDPGGHRSANSNIYPYT